MHLESQNYSPQIELSIWNNTTSQSCNAYHNVKDTDKVEQLTIVEVPGSLLVERHEQAPVITVTMWLIGKLLEIVLRCLIGTRNIRTLDRIILQKPKASGCLIAYLCKNQMHPFMKPK